MSLENLNLVELNAQEVQSVDGGFIPLIVAAVSYFCIESITNPVSSNNSLLAGFNAGNK